jgi:hypothetical protein
MAQIALARRLLTKKGAPAAPEVAVQWLLRARAAGAAAASAHLATLCGMGVGMRQAWSDALTFLAEAAERGWSNAHGQLHLLAGGPTKEGGLGVVSEANGGGTPNWRALAAEVDLAAWLAPPQKTPLAETPRIRVFRDFVSPSICRWLVDIGAGRMHEALVFDPEKGVGQPAEARSNSAYELNLLDLDLVVVMVRARIGAALRLPVGAMEPPQLLHYAVGQGFKRHYDFSDPEVPGYDRDIARRGQRIATFLIYLNDDYGGGETDFPRVGVRFKGAPGDALMFANVDLDGVPERLSLHEGLPPTAGEKWLFSQWVRDRIPI